MTDAEPQESPIELGLDTFGDVTLGDTPTRVTGVMVVDRSSGVLLRLDLSSAHPMLSLQRRLVRVDAAAP